MSEVAATGALPSTDSAGATDTPDTTDSTDSTDTPDTTDSTDTTEAWSCRPVLASADFPRTGWGHRGYDEHAVDEFVHRTQDELGAAQDQIHDLRMEVDRLHRYIRRQWAAVAAAEAAHPSGEASGMASPAAQARAVLTQAQDIARRRLAESDDRLAEAEVSANARIAEAGREAAHRLAEAERSYGQRIEAADRAAAERLDRADQIANEVLSDARQDAVRKRSQAQVDAVRLLSMARNRYEEIVIRAHQRADQAAEIALHDFEDAATQAGDSNRARVALEMKAAYLRTFAKVSRTALQAALDLTGREFDRLLGATAAIESRWRDETQVDAVPASHPVVPAPAAVPSQLGYPAASLPVPDLVVVKPATIVLPGTDEVIDAARVTSLG